VEGPIPVPMVLRRCQSWKDCKIVQKDGVKCPHSVPHFREHMEDIYVCLEGTCRHATTKTGKVKCIGYGKDKGK
jgi:hypothetical protein